MPHSRYRITLGGASAALLLVSLAGCSSIVSDFNQLFSHRTKTATHINHDINTEDQSERFLHHLALAKINLPANAKNTSTAEPYLKTLQNYLKRKHNRPASKPAILTAVILEYQPDSDMKTQKIIAPAGKTGSPNFSDMLDIMDQLNTHVLYKLYNISIAQVTVAPYGVLKIKNSTVEQVRMQLDVQQRHLMEHTQKLPWAEDARIQLALIHALMENHLRDAAYITVDNTKQLLATASEQHPDQRDAIAKMSQELESLEADLHETMPYTTLK